MYKNKSKTPSYKSNIYLTTKGGNLSLTFSLKDYKEVDFNICGQSFIKSLKKELGTPIISTTNCNWSTDYKTYRYFHSLFNII